MLSFQVTVSSHSIPRATCLYRQICRVYISYTSSMNSYFLAYGIGMVRQVHSTGKEPNPAVTETSERLQKFLSSCGVASRRHAEELITSGRVKCNDVVVTTLGTRIFPEKDVIEVDGKVICKRSCYRWVMVNKPLGLLTTARDDRGRKTVCDLVQNAHKDNLVPVGRLDQASTGLLLLTNETNWIHKLLHPKFGHSKEYIVRVKGKMEEKTLNKLRKGLLLPGEDKPTAPAVFKTISCYSDHSYVRVVIREGRKRQIRRMFLTVGHVVLSLERIRFGSLVLPSDLKPGKWRDLTHSEVAKLKKEIGHVIKEQQVVA